MSLGDAVESDLFFDGLMMEVGRDVVELCDRPLRVICVAAARLEISHSNHPLHFCNRNRDDAPSKCEVVIIKSSFSCEIEN